MRHITTILISLLTLLLNAQYVEKSYPLDAKLVPVSDAATLQDTLDKYKVIRLESGYYNTTITLKSDYEIYGLKGTFNIMSRVHTLIVEPGTENAILHTIYVATGLNFPESELVTRNNLFMNLGNQTNIYGTLENNWFINWSGLLIDNTSSGHTRNNKFLRGRINGTNYMPIIGSDLKDSYGNVFLWLNLTSPQGRTIEIENQKSITFALTDIESWNFDGSGIGKALWEVKNGEIFTGVALSSGQNQGDTTRFTGVYDLDVTKFNSYVGIGTAYNVTDPMIVLNEKVDYFSVVNSPKAYTYQIDNPNLIYSNIYDGDHYTTSTDSIIYDNTYGADLSENQINELETALTLPRGTEWETFIFNTVIPQRRSDSGVINDHSSLIQGLIDANGIAYLDSGVYYLSNPVYVGRDEGIIGHGKGKTVLRATSNDIDLIRIRQRVDDANYPIVTLIGFSLEDGKNGVHYYSDDPTFNPTFSDATVSDIEFYNMDSVGFFVDCRDHYLYAGMDNVTIENCDFIRCKFGFLQWVDLLETGYNGLMDKVVFYNNRFIEDSIGVYFKPTRGGNANSLIGCLFKDNITKDMYYTNQNNLMVSNSKFISPYVDFVIESRSNIKMFNTEILNVKSGAHILPYDLYADGVTVSGEGAELLIPSLSVDVSRVIFTNSVFQGSLQTTEMIDAMFFNNSFEGNETLSKKLVQVRNGASTVVINKPSNPTPGILIDQTESTFTTPINLNATKLNATTINIR